MKLTNIKVKNIKPAESPKKYFDGGGLYLEVSPKGNKWWRYKYRFAGKEKRISLGVYPEVSLKDARDRHLKFRSILAEGSDPSAHKKSRRNIIDGSLNASFEAITREWFDKNVKTWSESHSTRVIRSLEENILPWIGSLQIDRIKPTDILPVIRRIEKRGSNETAHRVLGRCKKIFEYAIASGRIELDPCAHLKGALELTKAKHFPAVTDPKKVGPMLRAFDSYQGSMIVHAALKISPLVFVRPGELRHAKWCEIDLDEETWSFTASKTKTPHIVPLSRQAIKILTNLKPITGMSMYVFHSARSRQRPMSDNAILAALRRIDISKDEMTGHGFRAMARTILDEVLGFRPDIIEQQLAHAVKDPLGRAYNRTAHLDKRKKMMQTWADYLDELKNGKD